MRTKELLMKIESLNSIFSRYLAENPRGLSLEIEAKPMPDIEKVKERV